MDSIVNKESFEGALKVGAGGVTNAYTPTVPTSKKDRAMTQKAIFRPFVFIVTNITPLL
jgi:hypothetical protein